MVEIRARDLRFTPEEAAAFLNRAVQFNLSAADLAALEERTEGWAAGLQLAALSMQGRSDTGAFIQSFTGSHVYIAEYLVDEVLKRQPEDIQAFLLQTCILDRLTASLCEAVTGCADGQDRLNHLLQANIFIVPLDDEGRWFRYHHLFADLLQARLQASAGRDAVFELHRRAAAWYEQGGMAAGAIEHRLAAQDFAGAARMIEQAALPVILQASVRLVENWLRALPPDIVEQNPRLNMAFVWLNILRGTYSQAVPYIDRLNSIFSSASAQSIPPSLRGEWLALQCELLTAGGRPRESRDLALEALQILPEVDAPIRGMVTISLAKAFERTLDYEHAAQVYEMIVRDARAAGDETFEILGTSGQGQMVLKQGRLHRTFEIVTEGIRRLESFSKHIPFGATLYGELGQVYFQWHQLDPARQNLLRSMQLSGKSGYSDPEIYYNLVLSKILVMQGDMEGALEEARKASRLARAVPPAMVREHVIARQVWADLAEGRRADAEQVLAAEGFTFGEGFTYPDLAENAVITEETGLLYNSALRVLLDRARQPRGRTDLPAGIDLAGRVIEGELRSQHLPAALETLLLLAQMHAAAGDLRQALLALDRALALAQPEGFISVFVEQGQPVADLLAEWLKDGLAGEDRANYAREIQKAFALPPDTGPALASPDQTSLVEPLSLRELEVLRLIARGDSNQEIANRLVITVSAVKKHAGNIYGKLNVSSRTQAVSRARQLGLLPPDS